jgi:Lon protease-like protein
LIVGRVELQEPIGPAPMTDTWRSLLNVLRSLETHPHVERMKLRVDYSDAWQVAYTLIQLLPLDEALKYELLGIDGIHELMTNLQALLNKLGGEE